MVGHVLVWVHDPDHQLVERTGLDQTQVPVRPKEDEARVVHTGPADDRVAEPDKERLIGREENVPRLRNVELRGTANDIVQAICRLIDIRLRQGRAGQETCSDDS